MKWRDPDGPRGLKYEGSQLSKARAFLWFMVQPYMGHGPALPPPPYFF